jgi:hypothetical protein
MSVAASIDFHRANGHISIDSYEKALIVQLGRSIESRIPVYLDVKFWILLRMAILSGETATPALELLGLLRNLVADGTIFCPISETSYLELVKQSDMRTRGCTARHMDELSLGVALIPYDRRIATELAVFLHSHGEDPESYHPLKHLVWTKVAYVLGVSHPVYERFDAATMLMLQKSFMDVMWATPLTELIDSRIKYFPGEDFDNRWAMTINTGVSQHAHELKSFQQALDDELRGAVSAVADIIMEVINDKAARKSIRPAIEGSKEYNDAQNAFQNVIYQALKRKPECRQQMPSFYIEASLHAAFRWNKTRRFKPNDMHDFHHACAALAYCGVFMTEGPLNSVLQSQHLGLNKLYACKVFSDVPSAIAHLRSLKVRSVARGVAEA